MSKKDGRFSRRYLPAPDDFHGPWIGAAVSMPHLLTDSDGLTYPRGTQDLAQWAQLRAAVRPGALLSAAEKALTEDLCFRSAQQLANKAQARGGALVLEKSIKLPRDATLHRLIADRLSGALAQATRKRGVPLRYVGSRAVTFSCPFCGHCDPANLASAGFACEACEAREPAMKVKAINLGRLAGGSLLPQSSLGRIAELQMRLVSRAA